MYKKKSRKVEHILI